MLPSSYERRLRSERIKIAVLRRLESLRHKGWLGFISGSPRGHVANAWG